MNHLFANVKWKCTACGAAAGSCGCWVKCECGRSHLRDEECGNQVWHIAKQFAEDAADKIIDDMAESYKLFQREHMAARLKRAVIRQTHQYFIDVFDGVESAAKDRASPPIPQQDETQPARNPCRFDTTQEKT